MIAAGHAKIDGYRPDVDGLRAVAVLSVVLFHLSDRLVPGGFVGVDIFFVISGYLISGILYREHDLGKFSFAEFYARRIRRLGPALVVVLLSTLALGWFVLLSGEYQSLGRHTASSAAFVSNLLLYREVDYFGAAAGEKPLLHLWSLAIEEQYYLFWPVLLAITWKWRANLTGALIVFVTLSFLACVLTTREAPAAAFYLPHTRYWELLIGASLAWNEHQRRRIATAMGAPVREAGRAVRETLSWVGIGMVAVALITLDKSASFPGWRAAIPVVGTAAVIAAGPRVWANRVLLGNRPMVYVGGLAYPIYLWHWPLLVFVGLTGATRQVKLLAVIAALVLAWLTKILVEDPIRFGFPSRRENRRATAWALFVALLVIGGIGIVTDLASGFPSRFPPAVQALASYATRPAEAAPASRHCFLGAEEGEQAFSGACAGTPATSGDSLVVVWGDSFGNHLMAGLEALRATEPFSLGQYTASACPPIPGAVFTDRRNCQGVNAFVLERLRATRPNTVILAANWLLYPIEADTAVAQAIRALRSIGVPHIVLVGPLPTWPGQLPALLARAALRQSPAAAPDRLDNSFIPVAGQFDAVMQQVADREGITYVSPLRALCDASSCRTIVPGSNTEPMQFDIGHLTPSGSRYLLKQVASQLGLP